MKSNKNLNETALEEIFGNWYIQLSKPTIKIFGLEAALLLCDLYSEYRYWKGKNRLQSNGSFYSTVENVEHNTGLTKAKQLNAIKVLVDYGIITKIVKGMPCKRYFSFNETGINKLKKDIKAEIKKDKERLAKRREEYGVDDMIGIYEGVGGTVNPITGEIYF